MKIERSFLRQRKQCWIWLLFDFWCHSTILCSQGTQSWDQPCRMQVTSDLRYRAHSPMHHTGLHRAQGQRIINPNASLSPHVEPYWMLAPEMFAFARELQPTSQAPPLDSRDVFVQHWGITAGAAFTWMYPCLLAYVSPALGSPRSAGILPRIQYQMSHSFNYEVLFLLRVCVGGGV